MAESVDDLINEPDPANLIHGLKDTGYDFYTAAADIIIRVGVKFTTKNDQWRACSLM